MPYAFTEQGIYMLMTVLKGELAVQTENNTKEIENIKIELKDISKLLGNSYDKEILILNGCQVESDLAYKKIYDLAKNKIYIIDDYINLKTLVLFKDIDKNIEITIFSDNVGKKLHMVEYEDFCNEYSNIKIVFKKTNNKIHDRYIVIDYDCDNEKIFHCGASSKDSGNKITTITEIKDRKIYCKVIDELLKNEELVL